jgi:hypothetical protein
LGFGLPLDVLDLNHYVIGKLVDALTDALIGRLIDPGLFVSLKLARAAAFFQVGLVHIFESAKHGRYELDLLLEALDLDLVL